MTALLFAAAAAAQSAPPVKALAPAEMRVRTEAIEKQITEDHRHVLHLQALVRKDKDVIKLTCVNDKMVQIKAQMNLFDNANLLLQGSIENSDDSPRQAFDDIEKAGAEVKKLRGEADGCAGALDMYKQESKADFERPELPDPTSGEPFNPTEVMGDPDVDVPGYATPYQ